jgi:hypothetical protein
MLATAVLLLATVFGASQAFAQSGMPKWQEAGWCTYRYATDRPVPPRLNLPDWACEATYNRGLQRTYGLYTRMNPFFISADFDGDGRSDIAIWVTDSKSRKRGILFLMQGRDEYFVAGAGKDPQERGNDYTYVDIWSLIPKGERLESVHESSKVVLRGDAIVAAKSESAAFAIYWDGHKFNFYQLTD